MYAIVRTGGKQYRVAEKTILTVEKLELEDGATVELTDVLMLSDGDTVTVGAPTVASASAAPARWCGSALAHRSWAI